MDPLQQSCLLEKEDQMEGLGSRDSSNIAK
jgi:hypothetical protein